MYRKVKKFFIEASKKWKSDNSTTLAAALAYYTLFSLAPLLLIVIAMAGILFGQEAAEGKIIGQVQGVLGLDGAMFVQDLVRNVRHSSNNIIASVIGIAVLMLGATGIFSQLQSSLDTIWNAPRRKTHAVVKLVREKLLSFGMVLVVGLLLIISLLASTVLAAFSPYINELVPGSLWVFQLGEALLSLAIITFLFSLMFAFLPNVNIRLRDAFVGGFITACLFVLGKYGLGWYLASRAVASSYGAAGSVVLILLWVYYSSIIFYFGAACTYVYVRSQKQLGGARV